MQVRRSLGSKGREAFKERGSRLRENQGVVGFLGPAYLGYQVATLRSHRSFGWHLEEECTTEF